MSLIALFELAQAPSPAAAAARAAANLTEAGSASASSFLVGLTVFILALFLGAEIISKIPTMLHTPLMSGSNAVSGITVVGAIIAAGSLGSPIANILGVLAIVLAMTNVVGGFVVTHRMLGMFRQKTR